MTAIPEALAALIAQQARFDQLRHHTNLRTNGRVADLAYANAYDGPPPAVIDALRTVIDDPRALNLQYTPYGGATKVRRLVARNLSKRHGLKYRFTDIVMTPGAMAGLNLALRPLASGPRREVIILTPCWLDYPAYVYNLGLTMRLVPLKAKSFDLDIEAIAAALSPNTAAIMLSQPANPTGLLYSRASLDALAEVLRSQAEPPLLIADETHRDVVFEPDRFVSPAEVYDRTVSVYSFGKYLMVQGQRIGYLAVSPSMSDAASVAEDYTKWCRIMGFCTPTALMQQAVPHLLGVKTDLTPVRRRREALIEAMSAAGYELSPSDATFFLYAAAPGGDDFAFTERLAERGTLVLPSSLFHHRGYFRLSVTGSEQMVEQALTALREVRT